MFLGRVSFIGKALAVAVVGAAGAFATTPANAGGFRLYFGLPSVVYTQPQVVVQQPVATVPVYAAPVCPAPVAQPVIVEPTVVAPAPVVVFNGGFWDWHHRDGRFGFFFRR